MKHLFVFLTGYLILTASVLTQAQVNTWTPAFGYIESSLLLPEGPCKFYLERPDSIISLAATTSPDPIVANTWGSGYWWAAEKYDPANGLNHGHLYTIDTLTGSMTDIGPLNQNLDALAYNHWSDSLYGLKSVPDGQGNTLTYIYYINTTTGNALVVDTLDFNGSIGGFTYNYNTNRYFTESSGNSFYSYPEIKYEYPDFEFNLSAVINSPGDMACNLNNNTLYLLSDLEGGALVRVDTSTIHGHLIGNLPAATKISGLVIPFTYMHPTAGDVGIVHIQYPKSGCLSPGEPVIFLLKNFGTEPVQNFDLSFYCYYTNTLINWGGEDFANASFGQTLQPGQEYFFAFYEVINTVNPGEYRLNGMLSGFPASPAIYPHHAGSYQKYFSQYCYPLACPDSALSESETCGLSGNNGCDLAEPAFDTIVSGNTVCGNNWHYGALTDRDWFYFELDSIRNVKFSAKAGTRLDLSVNTLPCENSSLMAIKTIEPNVSDSLVVMNLLPGKYAFVVNINTEFYNVSCTTPNKYTFHFETFPGYTCTVGTDTLGPDSLYISELTIGSNVLSNLPSPQGYTQAGNLMNPLNGSIQSGISIKTANSLPDDKASIWFDLNRNLAFDNPGERIDLTYNSVLQQWELPGPGFTFPASGGYNARARVSRNGIPEPCGILPGTDAVDFRVFVFTGPAELSFQLLDDCLGDSRINVRIQNAVEVTQLNFSIGFSSSGLNPEILNINPVFGSSYLTIADTSSVQFIWSNTSPLNLLQTGIFEIRLHPGWDPVTVINDLTVQNIFAGNQYTYPCNCNANLMFNPEICMEAGVYLRYADTNGNIIQGNNVVNFTGITPPFYQTTGYSTGILPITGFLANGTYQLIPATDHPWGGVNATDALLILKHYIGMSVLNGLPLKAADVNADQYVNSVDALLVLKRFTGMINSFPSGDWLFEPKTVNFTGSGPGPVHIPGICFGDVNASYGL